MRVLHVITGLNIGGAEVQLCGLCEGLQKAGYEQKVISLLAKGALSQRITDYGIECQHLGLRQDAPDVSGLGTLRREIREFRPDVIHSWMYHACLYTAVASTFLTEAVPNLWSIHYSSLSFRGTSFSTLSAVRGCQFFSYRNLVHIAYCAEAARVSHELRSFCPDRAMFLPNGYDPARFFFLPDDRESVRRQWAIEETATAFGMVARFDPVKDHATFLEAAALACRECSEPLRFVLIGDGMDRSNANLMELIERHGLQQTVILAGQRRDMPAVYSALDFVALSSRGEAFPNVLCEAMLCERTCISTDVGDCRNIIGDTGSVVPPASPQLMAQAMIKASRQTRNNRKESGAAARTRIVTNFSDELHLQRHIALYDQLCKGA